MNYLAHVFLAPDSPQARVGSVLGDFAKGIVAQALPREVQDGLRHHFRVDSYTDQHPRVRASKRLFSRQRRRFAGVALDLLYDHYLLMHWERFSGEDCDGFIRQVYREFAENEQLMPEPMVHVTRRMVAHDWFGQYRDLENIGLALDRVSRRIRFPHRFEGVIEEIRDHYDELETQFLAFFPDLQHHAQDRI